MSDEKEYVLGKQVLTEDDLKFTVDYKGDTFTLRYPTPFVKTQIEADIARRLGGMARESFSMEALAQIEVTAYANALVVPSECPPWFSKVKSLWDYYDENLAIELYRGYVSFRDRFRDDLLNDRFEANRAGRVPRSLGVQPLQDTANGPKV